MTVDWSAAEILIKLVPVGRPMGRSDIVSTVFREYGDSKTRAVQAIASKLGGETVYFESSQNGVRGQVVPLTGWRNTDDNGYVACITEFFDAAFNKGMKVICYGASREKWILNIESRDTTRDVVDNMSDKSIAGSGKAGDAPMVEANGIRREF